MTKEKLTHFNLSKNRHHSCSINIILLPHEMPITSFISVLILYQCLQSHPSQEKEHFFVRMVTSQGKQDLFVWMVTSIA
jgi:hypothetical protein